MSKAEQGLGTVRTVRSRTTGEITGYQALLPREHSEAPKGTKNPERYQQPIGPLCATEEEARSLLNAVLFELLDKRTLRNGLTFEHYVNVALKARLQDARRKYGNDASANKQISTWKSINKCWLSKAPFYEWPPQAVERGDLQAWFDYLKDDAESEAGEPLSGHYLRTVKAFVKAAFERADVSPNPADLLKLPKKGEPRFIHLELRSTRRLFAADAIDLADRIMAGCGMGGGLRVGELLSMEPDDVHLDDHDPHLVVRFGGPHHAPPKGKRLRRVELFEPGLGFWRIWMREFYSGGPLVFAGPKGGFIKAWPELFPSWAPTAGVPRMTSHIMRHTYAVAMLSGSWGYEPRTMEFVSQQLGHREVTTTERYYGAFEHGVWQRDVRQMTGREARPTRPITAAELLGRDASSDASGGGFEPKKAANGPYLVNPRQSPKSHEPAENKPVHAQSDALAHQDLAPLARGVLEAAAAADPTFAAKAIELATRVLAGHIVLPPRVEDAVGGRS